MNIFSLTERENYTLHITIEIGNPYKIKTNKNIIQKDADFIFSIGNLTIQLKEDKMKKIKLINKN
ncbi:hypothetical protein J4418_04215 [Candidatus Woesearchaeota archaeon]|nr:hypothetical protein [Candidatus Woesearchaeota archaeon]